jgi:glycosyltransferase involved in cell wall biosynthesis
MLLKCVASLLAGAHKPNEIVVVGRKGDGGTENAIAAINAAQQSSVRIRSVWITEPGHIPPVETGVRSATGDWVAVVDDDVTVMPEWLASLEPHFAHAAVGVVGGRVLVPGATAPMLKGKPGCISWYGKSWGNLGSMDGPGAWEVDTVMEGNCVWRRDLLTLLEFDPALNFDDASMYGLDLCLQAKKRGFRVIYEPRALVYHYPAPRAPELDRQERGRRLFSYCRNYTYIILKQFPSWRRLVFLGWWILIGERDAWGLGSLAFDMLSGDWHRKRSVADVWKGKTEGIRLWLK